MVTCWQPNTKLATDAQKAHEIQRAVIVAVIADWIIRFP
jgi:hypothetical protein